MAWVLMPSFDSGGRETSTLHPVRELTDLIEEDRSAIGALEPADPVAGRTGEGALDVAEEFTLQEVLRQSRAVHLMALLCPTML